MWKLARLGLRCADLEWLIRLDSESHRLFKRYLVSNTAFIYYFLTGRL